VCGLMVKELSCPAFSRHSGPTRLSQCDSSVPVTNGSYREPRLRQAPSATGNCTARGLRFIPFQRQSSRTAVASTTTEKMLASAPNAPPLSHCGLARRCGRSHPDWVRPLTSKPSNVP
jgi:hypothetical protein